MREATDSEVDEVMCYIDSLLMRGEFKVCDAILANLELHRVPTDLQMTYATITWPAKHRLPSRGEFLERVKLSLRARGLNDGELLDGLL